MCELLLKRNGYDGFFFWKNKDGTALCLGDGLNGVGEEWDGEWVV